MNVGVDDGISGSTRLLDDGSIVDHGYGSMVDHGYGSMVDHGSRGGWGHYVLWRRVCTICREGRGGGHFKLHFTRLCTLLDSLFKTIAEFESQEAALDFSRGRGPGVGRRGGLRRRGRGE